MCISGRVPRIMVLGGGNSPAGLNPGCPGKAVKPGGGSDSKTFLGGDGALFSSFRAAKTEKKKEVL
jgi:hypothetical protein